MSCRNMTLAAIFILPWLILGVAEGEEIAFSQPELKVPAGFSVELVAGPPLVQHPMMAGFDDRGRLYIAESAGLNLRTKELEEQLPNFIRMLEDTDGDGRFDKSTIFADKMTLPMGALWHDGALYVAAPPNIWRLEDTDDDGVADRRDIIVDQFGYSGNAASVHGLFLGPGGRLYWCDGRHGHEFRDDQGNVTSSGKAARIFSCRADGSDVRVHCGGGMDNPVEIDFTPEGEMLGTVNLFYRQRGDCLVHWMHGGVYPRYDQQGCIDEFIHTGDPLTEVHNLGHVGISGTTRYRGAAWGADFQNNFLITEFNTHKVMRARLKREGSSYRATVEDFLVSSSIDFHPTDVLQDSDGSLLVIDTGGWFRLGCPTSQIAKPNILGAIYRIRRSATPVVSDPRGQRIDWQGESDKPLAALLDDERFAVREKAIGAMARRGDSALAALDDSLKPTASRQERLGAVWVAARIGSSRSAALLRSALQDTDPGVRQAAAYGCGLLRDKQSVVRLRQMVDADEAPVRREAATALGKIGAASAVPTLLTALQGEVDRVLEHALIYALIEIDAPKPTAKGLADGNSRVRRASLIALDQMPSGSLTREMVTPLLDTNDFALQSATLTVIEKHEGWASEIVALLSRLLDQQAGDDDRQAMIRGALIAFSEDEKIQSLVEQKLINSETSAEMKHTLLEAIARCDLNPLPAGWAKAVSHSLGHSRGEVLSQAVAATAAIDSDQFDKSLLTIARDSSQGTELRIQALVVVAEHGKPLDAGSFRLLANQIGDEAPPMLRLAAARAIGSAELSAEQVAATAQLVSKAGPLEAAPLLAAFEKGGDVGTGLQLVSALEISPGLTSLSEASLRKLLAHFPDQVKSAAEPLLAKLQAATQQQKAHLTQLEQKISGGDAQLGKVVFLSKKTSCSACHRVGADGGKVGPDLTTVGQRRNHRDLLEAILYPSSSLARGFESYAISTVHGKIYSGVITAEASDAISLRTSQQTDIRVRRDEIEEMIPSRLSIMPAGLEKTMTTAELRNLIAYLQSLNK